MTKEEFILKVGREPEDDDLERCNCPEAGKEDHYHCGLCKVHGLPMTICNPCYKALMDSLDVYRVYKQFCFLTKDKKLEFIGEVSSNYCLYCMNNDPHCQCNNDE